MDIYQRDCTEVTTISFIPSNDHKPHFSPKTVGLAKLKRSRGLTTVATFFASGNQCPELNLKRTLWGLKAKNRIFPSQAQGQSTTLVALINEVIPQFEFLFSVSNKVNTRRIALSG